LLELTASLKHFTMALESGHLDCLFDCGLTFSSLDTLYLHVELNHREDNSLSPFAVHEAATRSQPQPYHNDGYAPSPSALSRIPPSIPDASIPVSLALTDSYNEYGSSQQADTS
jgi:hypothetical protein